MNTVGQPERATQNRVLALFRDEFGYRTLGDWMERPDNGNIEGGLLTAYLKKCRCTPAQIAVADAVGDEVRDEVKKLLMVCHGAMTRKQIQEKLHLKGERNFRKLYLVPAFEKRLIEKTIPDRPNSRLRKYRLTDKGSALLEYLRKGSPASCASAT